MELQTERPSTSRESSRARSPWGDLLFWGVAIVLLLANLGVRELWTAEDRWAEITRWMVLSGDYLHPRINGQPYFDKPLLGYWSIVGAAFLTGGVNELAIRLPSALAGLLALAATRSLGSRLWSPMVGRTAGWILLSCYGFLFWARTGQADMENLAFIMLAVAWYWASREKPAWIKWSIFYALCLVGAQMKGLAALAVPVISILPDLFRENRWKQCLRPGHWLGLAFGLGIYLAPFLAESRTRSDYDSSGLDLVFRENIQRYFSPFDHAEPFYVYLYYLPLLFLPWSVLWLIGVWTGLAASRRERFSYSTRWLLEATLLVFLFFSASGSRRSYYILPLLPFCALMTAGWLDSAVAESRAGRIGLRIQAGLCVAMTVALLVLVPVGYLALERRVDLPLSLLTGSLVLGLLAMLPWILVRVRPVLLDGLGIVRHAVPHLLASTILLGGFFAVLHSASDTLRTRKAFARELGGLKLGGSQVAFYRSPHPDVIFYLDASEAHPVLQEPAEIDAFLEATPQTNLLIVSDTDWSKLRSSLATGEQASVVLEERKSSWESNSSRTLLAVGLRP